jgi:hypothetical protein
MKTTMPVDNQQLIQQYLTLFFPSEHYTPEVLQEAIDNRDVFYDPAEILRYLQTALMDDKILEVEIDGLTRIYFSRLYDEPPPLVNQEKDGQIILVEPEYTPAEYLKNMAYFNSWPLEPALGNVAVRKSQNVLFRLFTSTYAVELGTFFRCSADVRDVPVLRFEYPVIGRVVRGARAYRAKVPKAMQLAARITDMNGEKPLVASILDISARGMALMTTKEQEHLVVENEDKIIEILFEDETMTEVKGNIRHMTKIRGKKGADYVCGFRFDLETRAIASKIESIVAQVQRAHLKEISDLSEESGVNLIV